MRVLNILINYNEHHLYAVTFFPFDLSPTNTPIRLITTDFSPLLYLCTPVGLKYLDEAPANGVGHASSSDQVTSSLAVKPAQEQGAAAMKPSRGNKEVVFDVAESRRSSNSAVYVPDESDSEEEEPEEQELDLLDDTSRIPRY